MEKLWKYALSVGGVSAIGAFLFWSLYRDWLQLPLFSHLTSEQTFIIMLVFLGLTFLALVSILIVHVSINNGTKVQEQLNNKKSNLQLVEVSLDPMNRSYVQTENKNKITIQPCKKEY